MNIFKKPECRILFNEGKHRHRHKLKDRNKKQIRYPTFFSEDDISGKFELIKTSSSFDYSSINIELIGLIDNYRDPKNSVRFLWLSKDISKNGSLTRDITSYNFNFKNVRLPYESYKGDAIGVKYMIKVNIFKMMRTISYEEEFVVVKPNDESILKKNDEPISMNVGIKELLSVLIEFEHVNYGIHGTLKGFVSFGKVNMLLTKMEVQLIKKETVFGTGAQRNAEPKIIATFELIDGGPYKNETIPFRFFLEPYNLTPSYTDVAGNFSVRYYLNLIIKDQKNNRYFKQKEIFLYRLYLKNSRSLYNTLKSNQNNNLNDIEQLKDFITEPIDYGDYFSVFNDIDEEKENSKEKINIKEPEPDDFYFRSTLTGYIIDNEGDEEEEQNQINNRSLRNMRSNTTFDIRKRNLPVLNDKITNRNTINEISNKKSSSVKNKTNKSNNKENRGKNQVINIKEKNKYKNNDIFINDNYYNTDNYIIYENSYQNIFDDKLKKNRIKYSNLMEKNKIDEDEEDEKQQSTSINDDTNENKENKNDSPLVNSINDYNLYYPNEPFSSTTIMSNFPSSYGNIGQSGDFRQNLMGSRIKNTK